MRIPRSLHVLGEEPEEHLGFSDVVGQLQDSDVSGHGSLKRGEDCETDVGTAVVYKEEYPVAPGPSWSFSPDEEIRWFDSVTPTATTRRVEPAEPRWTHRAGRLDFCPPPPRRWALHSNARNSPDGRRLPRRTCLACRQMLSAQDQTREALSRFDWVAAPVTYSITPARSPTLGLR